MNDKLSKEYGIVIGNLEHGKNNLITDVKGVKVGNLTFNDKDIKTGITVILPHEKNIFKEKVMASSFVINGFGKSTGLVQIEELGNIETPIVLTNTLSVGAAHEGLVKYMLKDNEDIGDTTGTVNPIICECNDGYLNDIRKLTIKSDDVLKAIDNSNVIFDQGAVGAGTGMVCCGLKGGIGSSSRVVKLDDKEYVLGTLVLSNFGRRKDLMIDGEKIGEKIESLHNLNKEPLQDGDKGSIIMIIATDIPLNERQLKRLCKRATISLGRVGSHIGNGSGDIVIGFTTANKINHYEEKDIVNLKFINENKIDIVFRAVIESLEESILNSMIYAETTEGRKGNKVVSLKEYLDKI